MDRDFRLRSEWIRAETRLLKVLSRMESGWAAALLAAHQCQHLETKPPHGCVADLDKALAEASDLKKLVDEYVTVLEELKGLAGSE